MKNIPTPPKAPSAPKEKMTESTENKPETPEERRAKAWAKLGKRVLIYGEAGVGKTTLATKITGRTLFFDLEGTLPDLFDEDSLPENIMPCYPADWKQFQEYLGSDRVANYDNVIVDSLTTLESMWWTYISTHCRKAREGYGMVDFSDAPYPTALKDEKELGGGGVDSAKYAMWTRFENIICDVIKRGVNFINLCHDCDKEREDASDGIDTKHEPRLLDPKSGKNSIRKRAIEFHGEVWYIKWERVRKDDSHLANTGRRIILGQPDADRCDEFNGITSKSRRGFSVSYLDEFDINEVLGLNK